MMLPVGAARQRLLAAAVVVWAAVWIAVGAVTAVQIRNLTQVSDSLVESSQALDTAGTALQAVGRLPVVGERPRRLGKEVRDTAGEIEAAAASSRDTIHSVSLLLGGALVVIPILPVIGVYVPLRVSLARQRRAVARALDQRERNPRLEQFLAHRAVQNLGYDVLRQVSEDPWGDLERGAYRRLANAELTRLGLAGRRRPSGSEAPGPGAGASAPSR